MAIVTAPWVARSTAPLGAVLYVVGGLVCHQQAERSFHLAGSQLPVCARCLGLYAGGAVGLAFWAIAAPRARRVPAPRAAAALIISGIPTGLTVAAAWLGLGDPANIWRAAFALPLGTVAGWVVGAAATKHLK
jgi:uncharacterized membrane protein